MIKQVIVIPTHLGMSPGKIASQCCHAAVSGASKFDVEKRIILKAKTEAEFNDLYLKGIGTRMIYFSKIVDEGLTEVPPFSTTALSFIGEEKQVDKITGKLELL